jgi:hypothetical protein
VNTNGTIRKSELAALLGVSRSRVSQWVRAGLPKGPRGLLNKHASLSWIGRFQSSIPGNVLERRGGGAGVAERAAELLASAGAPSVITCTQNDIDVAERAIIERLLATMGLLLPNLLAALKAPPAAILAAGDIVDSMFYQALDGATIERLYGMRGLPRACNRSDPELCATFRIRLTKKLESDAEKFLAKVDALLEKGLTQ